MARKPAISRSARYSTSITLPDVAFMCDGGTFDPRLDVWSKRGKTDELSLNFLALKNISYPVLQSAKATLLWFAENRSIAHTQNLFRQLLNFVNFVTHTGKEFVGVQSIDLLNYRAKIPENRQSYMGALRVLLRKWDALGYPYVEPAAVQLLKEMRLKSNEKGVAVTTFDPHNGPFTDLEVEAIQSAINAAYAAGKLGKRHYLLAWLFILLGQRPVQYTNLRICDLSALRTTESSTYFLKIPRAKQRTGGSRTHFTQRALLPQFGALLAEYTEELHKSYAGKLTDPLQTPLFPGNFNASAPESFEYHLTAQALSREFRHAISCLRVVSERTGSPLHITATRFRRTVGTRAAAEGHGELIIAELLDHSDTSNAGIYVQATPAIVERIDRAIAQQLAPLAQAFAGVLIRDESEAVRGDDPRSRIVDPRLNGGNQPMGSCGKYGFCGFAAPIACYTCANFQPWLDGPHDVVLSLLLEERERLVRETDIRIAAINDRTILAVAEVVRRCEAARVSGADSHG